MTFSSLRPLCISPIERYAVRGRSGCDMRGRSRCLAHSSCQSPYSTWRNRILPHLLAACRRYSPPGISTSVTRFYRHRCQITSRGAEEIQPRGRIARRMSGERPAILQSELIAAMRRGALAYQCRIRHESTEFRCSHRSLHVLSQRAISSHQRLK